MLAAGTEVAGTGARFGNVTSFGFAETGWAFTALGSAERLSAIGAGLIGGCAVFDVSAGPVVDTLTSAVGIPKARSTADRIARSCSKVRFADSAA